MNQIKQNQTKKQMKYKWVTPLSIESSLRDLLRFKKKVCIPILNVN